MNKNYTQGWVKLPRSILAWDKYRDNVTKAVYIHLLLTASYEPVIINGVELASGQVLTTVRKLASELNLSAQQTKTALSNLQNENKITKKSTNKFSIITLINTDVEADTANETNKQNNQQNNQRNENENSESNKSTYLKKEFNNIKETKKKGKKSAYGLYKNVLLSDEELEKLKTEFPVDWEVWIEKVSGYCAQTGRTYKNYLATIRNWSKKENQQNTGKKEEKETEKIWLPFAQVL